MFFCASVAMRSNQSISGLKNVWIWNTQVWLWRDVFLLSFWSASSQSILKFSSWSAGNLSDFKSVRDIFWLNDDPHVGAFHIRKPARLSHVIRMPRICILYVARKFTNQWNSDYGNPWVRFSVSISFHALKAAVNQINQKKKIILLSSW